jgi:hypothetical protein
MPIKLISPGGGSLILDANTTASNYTMYIPAENGALLTSGSAVNASIINTGTLSSDRLPTIPRAKMPAGSILQVQQGTYNTRMVYSGISSWRLLDNLFVSITPYYSTSKILISCSFPSSTAGMTSTAFRWYRAEGANAGYFCNGTGYSSDWDASFRNNGTGDPTYHLSMAYHEYLDSPATTSTITYRLYFRPYDGGRTNYFNGGGDAAGNADRSYCVMTMTAKEVAQ